MEVGAGEVFLSFVVIGILSGDGSGPDDGWLGSVFWAQAASWPAARDYTYVHYT